jgi:hypothetical protein
VPIPSAALTRSVGFLAVVASAVRIGENLADALRQAAAAHGEHEQRTGHADPDWPDWYALYMVRERAGEELPR